MSKIRPWGWFLILQVALGGFVFRDALWGGSLLAPLDIAPNLFSKFRYVDPAATGAPVTQHTIDQLTFDLPVQHTIHQALRRGEIAWWDPYTLGGWPMLADAHSNGFDWTRLLLYRVLPFELAYNWTRIAHSLWCGLGMFLLLRRLKFSPAICVLMAGAYPWAGCLTINFMHPWIESAILWYPFLWLAWDDAFRQGGWRPTLLASVIVTGILYGGSIQTHSYLGLLAMSLGLGYAGVRVADWKRWLRPVVVSGMVGVLLAAPVLSGQVELFLLSDRQVNVGSNRLAWLSGAASLTAVFPWCLGTFRTLDASKFFGQYDLGFSLFIGSAALVLAVLGAWQPFRDAPRRPALRASLVLVAMYFVILSTPLLSIFYTRCSALAVIGLTVLAAHGLEGLASNPACGRRAGWVVAGAAILLAVALHVAAWMVYPRMVPRLQEMMARHDQAKATLDAAPELRSSQIARLPREISFQNPAALLAWISLLGLAVWLIRPEWRSSRWATAVLLSANLLPVVLVAQDFIPRHRIELWHRLRDGGPEQQKVAAVLADTSLRLWELSPGSHDLVMPAALPQLYRVRTVHGYTSLQPRTLFGLPRSQQETLATQMADWIYEVPGRGLATGTLRTNLSVSPARFHWTGPTFRRFTPRDRGRLEIEVDFEAGAAGNLLWTDTHYPGWQAWLDGQRVGLEKSGPCFSLIPVSETGRHLVLRYRPRFLSAGLVAAGVGLIGLAGMGLAGASRRRRTGGGGA